MTVEYHWDLIQKSDEWYALRTGMLTASKTKSILTPKLKITKPDKTSAFGYEIVAQRATNNVEDTFQSWAMQRGNVEEIYAKDLYSKHKEQVKDCGFITNDKLGFIVGMSPDGLVGEDGGVEIKSRCQYIQAQTIIEDIIPEEDMLQVQKSLFISERKWWDYVSYSNGMHMYIKRAYPLQEYFDKITEAALIFEAKVRKDLTLYKENCERLKLIPTERKDHETGLVIKPSENAEEYQDLTAAG